MTLPTPTTPSHRRRGLLWIALAVVAVLAATAGFVAVPRWLGDRPPAEGDEVLDGDIPTRAEGKLPASLGKPWKELDDPARDGWDTEVASDQADHVLKNLGQLLVHPEELDAAQLAPFLTADFSCRPLRPALRTAFSDHVLTVERGTDDGALEGQPGAYRGAEGLAAALRAMTEPFRGASDLRFKFKMFRITPAADGSFTTRQYLALFGRTASGAVEQNATWLVRWRPGSGNEGPRLAWIGVPDFEQVTCHNKGGLLFCDCTRSVLAKNSAYRDQFLRGMNYWFERIQDTRYFSLFGNPGLAIGDVNGDGLDDLFVCQETGLPCRLFLQQPNGSARDASEEWGVNWLIGARSALLIDLDNDGKQDLVVAAVSRLIVASNEGHRFQIRALLPCDDDTMSLAAADYDQDGRLDLYVCVYFSKDELEAPRAPRLGGITRAGTAAEAPGGRNSLFHNEVKGDTWRFTDVTAQAGLDVNNRRPSFAACWEDFDNDGHLDLYVANDYGNNNLYRNNGDGTFTDVADKAGAADPGFGMSVSWGDYDQDGLMDAYIGNMFSAAGGRITHQERFHPGAPQQRERLQRFARGNTLLRNLGGGRFADVSDEAAVTMGRWAWSCNFVDINNDSREDLVVANGFLTADETSGDL